MSEVLKVALAGECTIFAAQAVKQELLTALAGGAAVEVDLSRVSEIDSAGLQLLVAAKREAGEKGVALSFSGHSPAVLEVWELCDLAGHFGDPVLLPRP